MKITLKKITVRDLVQGYEDNAELGVRTYDGKLDVRPSYQREFIYKPKERDAVLDTVANEFPLNVMYWAVRDDGTYEIIDGQQRTISICQYVEGDFAIDGRYFHNLQQDEKDHILDYGLTVYLCSGTDSEKLKWFETINIAGAELTAQELKNAVYHGTWVTDAKRYFSRATCPAVGIGEKYVTGSPIRQDYLETVIKWIAGQVSAVKTNAAITDYMATHQAKPNAKDLWNYFERVMKWVKVTFPNYRKEMKTVQWGFLYNEFGSASLDPVKLEERVTALMADDEVTRKSGIYPYVLTGNERNLSIRTFTDNQKREAYEQQQGICPACPVGSDPWPLAGMEADHITPWSLGGKTIAANCKMLCTDHNRTKSGV